MPPVDLDMLLSDGMSMGEPTLQAAAERQVTYPITMFLYRHRKRPLSTYMCGLSVGVTIAFCKALEAYVPDYSRQQIAALWFDLQRFSALY